MTPEGEDVAVSKLSHLLRNLKATTTPQVVLPAPVAVPPKLPALVAEVRLRNNRLVRRRAAMGLTQVQLASYLGVTQTAYSALESLRTSPISKKGVWRPLAHALAAFYDVDLSELFPPEVLDVRTRKVVRELNLQPLLAAESLMALPSTTTAEDAVAHRELEDTVAGVLKTLSPREARVIELHYGLGSAADAEGLTLSEVGRALGVSHARAQQLVARALRKLRHPLRADPLKEFIEG